MVFFFMHVINIFFSSNMKHAVEDETEWRWKGHKSKWNQNKNIDLLHGECICSVVFSPHFTYQRIYLTDDLSRLFINTRIQRLYITRCLKTVVLHKLIEWHRDNIHKASLCVFHISFFFSIPHRTREFVWDQERMNLM